MGQLSAESHRARLCLCGADGQLQEWCISNALTLLPQRKTRKPALLKAMPPHSSRM
jgi:hypothetical protein